MDKVITFTNSGDTDVSLPLMGRDGAFKVIPAHAGVEDSGVEALTIDGDDIIWYPSSKYEANFLPTDVKGFYADFLAQYPQITMEMEDASKYPIDVKVSTVDSGTATEATINKVVVGETEFNDPTKVEVFDGTYDIVITYNTSESVTLEGVKVAKGENSVAVYVVV